MHPGSLELIRTYAYVLVLVSAAFTTHGLRTISQLPITPGSRVVDSAESFKTALLDNVQHIIFSGNVTLDSTLFPGAKDVPLSADLIYSFSIEYMNLLEIISYSLKSGLVLFDCPLKGKLECVMSAIATKAREYGSHE